MKRIEVCSSSGYTRLIILCKDANNGNKRMVFQWENDPVYLSGDDHHISKIDFDCGYFHGGSLKEIKDFLANGFKSGKLEVSGYEAVLKIALKCDAAPVGKMNMIVSLQHAGHGAVELNMVVDPSCLHNIDGASIERFP